MSYIKQMFESHPVNPSSDHAAAIECITACYSCAEACNACSDACLAEPNVAELVGCIRDNNDCADICVATGRVISRFTRTDFKLAGHNCERAPRRAKSAPEFVKSTAPGWNIAEFAPRLAVVAQKRAKPFWRNRKHS